MLDIRFVKLTPDAIQPTKAYPTDAGWDLYAACDSILYEQGVSLVQTGIAAAIPDGCCGLICDRSSYGRDGIKVMGGVIDSSYRGEIIVQLAYATIGKRFVSMVSKGQRIAQLLILPVPLATWRQVGSLDETERGDNGFGSTGA